jgi:DNA-binding MarR family transcriptional regulator
VSNHLTLPKELANQASGSPVERAVAGYRELVEVLSAAHTPEFPDPSVTMAQMRVLMLLGAVGEARMSDLAPKLGISLSTLSSLVEKLVEAGFAQRRDDPRDRRNVLVSLTTRGTSLLDTMQELGMEHLRTLLLELDDKAIATVTNAIELLVGAARRLTPEDPS